MRKTSFKKFFSTMILFVLIAAMALVMSSCGQKTVDVNSSDNSIVSKAEEKTTFNLEVIDGSGEKTTKSIETDKSTVGDALFDQNIINKNGTMFTEVNGILADYNVDKTYWAFYINGEYATKGVFDTPITSGATYTLKIEK